MEAITIEKLDQEITLHLQRIDSNLSYCFQKITQDIIPHVQQYGDACDRIMDSGSWLGSLFQATGAVNLGHDATIQLPGADQELGDELTDPKNTGQKTSSLNKTPLEYDSKNDVTSTGHVLKLPESSDEDEKVMEENVDGSIIQRQKRQRKVSALLQERYGSSSSVIPSPDVMKARSITHKNRRLVDRENSHDSSNDSSALQSSPMRNLSSISPEVGVHHLEDHSSSDLPGPGTVLHFSTNQG